MLDVRRARPEDLERVGAFYRGWNYQRTIGPSPVIVIAELDRELVGVVRLEPEHGTTVLRGMRVQPAHQRHGIGAAMLQAVRQQLGERECYCIAYAHLIGFYGRIGFVAIDPEDAPAFLYARFQEYSQEHGDFVVMRRLRGNVR